MLAELLAVTVAILVIFTIIYSNYFPTVGEYEKRMAYADIDSEYAALYTRILYLKMLHADVISTDTKNIERNFFANKFPIPTKYLFLIKNKKCDDFSYFSKDFQTKCENFADIYEIEEVILTRYNIQELKAIVPSDANLVNLTNYINYLPNYSENTQDEFYRLIIKTKKGYATTQFYSKKCEPFKYGEWQYSFNPCTGQSDICEGNQTLYVNLGKWGNNSCPVDEKICETTKEIYRTKSSPTSSFGEWTTTPCDETNTTTCEKQMGLFYRQNVIRDKPYEPCMSNEKIQCESRTNGFKSRTKTENDSNNFSVTQCN